MHWIIAIVLGLVEGLTEFLPVSSSGHLIVVRQLLGDQAANGLAFDAIVQAGTVLAAVMYFRTDILRLIKTAWAIVRRRSVEQREKILLYGIILGTIPGVVAGLLLEKKIETIFRSPHLVAWALILGSLLFWAAEKWAKKDRELTLKRAVAVGFYQCLAVIPGMSRSGSTISGGLLLGLTREEATRFSFLLSIPILVGAGLKKLWDVHKDGSLNGIGPDLVVATVFAFAAGYATIRFLIRYLKNHSLTAFVWYRVIVGILILLAM